MSPSILGNDPGRLVNGDFTRSSGLIAAAAIFSTLFVIGMWALFYVYWYVERKSFFIYFLWSFDLIFIFVFSFDFAGTCHGTENN